MDMNATFHIITDELKAEITDADVEETRKDDQNLASCMFYAKRYVPSRLSELDRLNWLQEDSLTIQCDLELMKPSRKNPGKLETAALHPLLKNLYEDGEFNDIKIVCGEISLRCHKAVLAAMSPVFKSMFSLNMAEKQLMKVEIVDLSPVIIVHMIKFIYTGR